MNAVNDADGVSGFVTLVGRPNVGKSTLINRLVGRKIAITSPRPQTTRNRIVGVLTRPGAQLVILDTPGLMTGERSGLNRYMATVAATTGADTDVIVFIVDPTRPDLSADKDAWKRIDKGGAKLFLAVNKADALPRARLLPVLAEWSEALGPFAQVIPLSAKTGENVDALVAELVKALPTGPHFYPDDIVTDQPERFFIAETIREKAFLRLSQELPYSLAVTIDRMEDRPNGVLAVAASILVERDSQKGIVIGKQGAMLKEIGSAARRELERRFETKVYLELLVKVRKQWTGDAASLRELGYDSEHETS